MPLERHFRPSNTPFISEQFKHYQGGPMVFLEYHGRAPLPGGATHSEWCLRSNLRLNRFEKRGPPQRIPLCLDQCGHWLWSEGAQYHLWQVPRDTLHEDPEGTQLLRPETSAVSCGRDRLSPISGRVVRHRGHWEVDVCCVRSVRRGRGPRGDNETPQHGLV